MSSLWNVIRQKRDVTSFIQINEGPRHLRLAQDISFI
jgi:hypothetical protein